MKMNKHLIALTLTTAIAVMGCGGNTGPEEQPKASVIQSLEASKQRSATASTSAEYTMVVQQLYVAYFGRPADPGGLKNFADALVNTGAPTDIQGLAAAYSKNPSIRSIIDAFGVSAESNALYGGTTLDFINSIYSNVLGRSGDAGGVSFWAGAVASGDLSKANAALSIMAGALSNTTTQGVIDGGLVRKRIRVATAFTAALVNKNLTSLYAGNQAAASARAMLTGVSATSTTTNYQALINGTPVTFDASSVPVIPQLPTEGLWAGTTSNGWNVTIASLENGEVWGIYGVNGTIHGVVQGTLASNGSFVTGFGRDYAIAERSVSSSSINGSVIERTVLNLNFGDGVSFNGAYQPAYEQMASLPAAAGSYLGVGVSGTAPAQSVAVSISPAGEISAGSAALGCLATGLVRARPTLKNIFDVAVTFTGANCALGNTTTNGIGVYDTTVVPARFYIAALKADKSDGFLWVGSK